MTKLQTVLALRDEMTSKFERIDAGIRKVADSGQIMVTDVTAQMTQTQNVFDALTPPSVFPAISESAEQAFSAADIAVKKTADNLNRLNATPPVEYIDASQLNKMELMEKQVSLLEGKWSNQRNLVASLAEEYNHAVTAFGRGSEEAAKLDNALFNAQMQENNLALQCIRSQEAIERQADAGNKTEQAIVRQQIAEQRLAKLKTDTQVSEQRLVKLKADTQVAEQKVFLEAEKTNLAVIKQGQENIKTEKAIVDKALAERRVATETERANLLLLKQQETESRIAREQDRLNQKLKEGTDHAGGLMGKLKGMAAAYLGFNAVKGFLNSTIGGAGQLNQQITMMQGMFGNADVGDAYFQQLQDYALKTGQTIESLGNVTQQFLGVTKNTDKLMAFNQIAAKLAVKNPTQGVEGAGYAINEALSGQYSSLRNRFNLTGAQLEPIRKAVAKGNLDGITEAFNQSLNMAGITDEVVSAFQNSAPQQFERIENTIQSKLAQAGTGALEALEPALKRINAWLESDRAAQFFNIIGNGLSMLVNGAMWVGDTVSRNWSTIQPILMAAGIMLAGVAGVSVAGAILSATAWLAAAAPFLLLGGVIALVIAQLKQAGVTTEQIVGFIGGLFGGVVAYIQNCFIYLWNLFVDVSEFFANVFIDPAYAVKKLFYDVSVDVLKFFDNMLQGIASGINWVIDKINQLTGSNMQHVQVNFVSGLVDKLELGKSNLKSDKNVVDLSGMKKEYVDYSATATAWSEKATGLFKDIDNSVQSFSSDISGWNMAQNDNLSGIKGDTGKISKDVDISSEQLKWLRDIAEKESINQYTNQTLVPQLQVSFGDVRETADVDKILGRITEMVKEELAVGAEGVHT